MIKRCISESICILYLATSQLVHLSSLVKSKKLFILEHLFSFAFCSYIADTDIVRLLSLFFLSLSLHLLFIESIYIYVRKESIPVSVGQQNDKTTSIEF